MTDAKPISHLTSPYITGSTVIGIKFDKGIIMACDTMLSYGGLLKYKDIERFAKIKDNLVIASTGEYADFQQIKKKLKDLKKESFLYDDGIDYTVQEYAHYLSKIAYDKRNKGNPYYNSTVIGGIDNGSRFVGYVDMYGDFLIKDCVIVGFGKHFCNPILSNHWDPNLSEEETKALLKKCFQVLFLKDCHASDTIQFTVIDDNGVRIEEPFKLETRWQIKGIADRANEKLWQ